MFFKIAQNVSKYLGYFRIKVCLQDFFKKLPNLVTLSTCKRSTFERYLSSFVVKKFQQILFELLKSCSKAEAVSWITVSSSTNNVKIF